MSARVALVCCVGGLLPRIAPYWQTVWTSQIGTIMPAMILTAHGNLATTLMFVVQITGGTILATAYSYVLAHAGIDGNPVVSIIVFGVLSFLTLFLNFGMKVRIFAIRWLAVFAVTLGCPGSTLEDFMKLQWDSAMTGLLVVQIAGSALIVLAMVFPIPRTSFINARSYACKTAETTATLLLEVCTYYCGSQPNLAINVWNSSLAQQRQTAASMQAAVDVAWWEGFDLGFSGVKRAALGRHSKMLQQVDRRLHIMHVCSLREDFAESHLEVLGPIKHTLQQQIVQTGDLLMAVTLATADCVVDKEENENLKERMANIEKGISQLASEWHTVRSQHKEKGLLSSDLRTESFVVCEVSRCGHLVLGHTNYMLDLMTGTNIERADDFHGPLSVFKSLFNKKKVLDPTHLDFVLRNFVSLMISFILGTYLFNFNSAMPSFVALMLSDKPGAALLGNLGRIQGTVLGTLVGNVLYIALHDCDEWVLKFIAFFIFEWGACFVYYYSDQFSAIGALLAIFGGSVLITHCDSELSLGDISALKVAAYDQFYMLALALATVTIVDLVFRGKSAAILSQEEAASAMDKSMDFFTRAMSHGDEAFQGLEEMNKEVLQHIDMLETFAFEANQEPRWHRAPFRYVLSLQLLGQIRKVHLDIMTVLHAIEGTVAHDTDGIHALLAKCKSFERVTVDLEKKLKFAREVVKVVCEHDLEGPLDGEKLLMLHRPPTDAPLNKLDGLQELTIEIEEMLVVKPSKSMAHDRTCRYCIIIELLEMVVMDVADLVEGTMECM